MGIIQYAQERHKEKPNTVCVCVWGGEKKTTRKERILSKTSNLLRLHQTGTTLLRAHAQVTE